MTVTITDDGNPALVAYATVQVFVASSNSNLSTDQDTPEPVDLTPVDPDTYTYTVVLEPAKGTVSNVDGVFTFDPGSEFIYLPDAETAIVTFVVKITDSLDVDIYILVAVTVTGLNDAPWVDEGLSWSAPDRQTLMDIDLAAWAHDPEGSALTLTVYQPDYGSLVLNTTTNKYDYFPQVGYVGPATFSFKANDGNSDSALMDGVILCQDDPFTSGRNARGAALPPGNRATILGGITRLNPADLPRMPAGSTFRRVTGTANGFMRGVVPANTLLGPSGCGPCVGVIIYPTDPTLPTYAFHFGFDPRESPVLTFYREIIQRNANWVQLRGGYRAVLCGAEVGMDAGVNARSAALLAAAVIGINNTLQVTITGYAPGPSVAVDAAGTVYWTTQATVPVTGY